MEKYEVMQALAKGLADKFTECGFEAIYPDGASRSQAPVIERKDSLLINYTGKKGKLRLLFSGDKIFLLAAPLEAVSEDDTDYTKLSTNLFIIEEYNEKDVKSLTNELAETLDDNFGKKDIFAKKSGGKKPAIVSRSAANSGVAGYDSHTLAVKLLAVYPELKEAYNENIESYGDFLCEDFFKNHCTEKVLETISSKDNTKLRKLFNILNEIYDNGTNEVQNLICVSILGQIKNDPDMITTILPLMGDAMLEPALEVNKILGKSKSQNMRLENPPKYKPKKKKSGGFFQTLLGGGQPGLNQ